MPHDPENVPTKICRNCGHSLPATEFRLRRRGGTARESDCRSCHNRAARRHREKKRTEAILEFAQAGKWRTDAQYFNRVARQLVAAFGGVEALASEYITLYEKLKNSPGRQRDAANLLISAVRLLSLTAHQ